MQWGREGEGGRTQGLIWEGGQGQLPARCQCASCPLARPPLPPPRLRVTLTSCPPPHLRGLQIATVLAVEKDGPAALEAMSMQQQLQAMQQAAGGVPGAPAGVAAAAAAMATAMPTAMGQ